MALLVIVLGASLPCCNQTEAVGATFAWETLACAMAGDVRFDSIDDRIAT